MPSTQQVKDAVQRGLAFPCAMCKNYWDAAPSNGRTPLGMNWHCHKTACGGPMVGRSFPEFVGGLLPEGDWAHFCFVCACPHDLSGVRVVGASRMLAVCDVHKKVLDDYVPVPRADEILHARPVLVIDRKL